ncbi:MAG TPA: sn-glycerol-3-phosphate ABC transporter ATP-binding protein UgpC [Streptosporangiaceae bacterium]|nr:sn-glycerol-3-phosphate ABC transporter ATP-binding protein UgpC [Streptosporangiaceae bacterium]
MATIVLEGITKRFPDGTTAVRSLDLAIADGELMVLVGPSGCGKTTALRMVAGLEEATEGTILIGGRAVNDVEPRDRDIAMVFQSYALYPHLTVRQNMAFSLKYRGGSGKDEIKRRVDEAARILELEPLLERKPRQLSGGQRQRVAMGRAIVRQPQAFLMDEPLSNLDAKLRVQMRAEIARLQRSLGVTTIYVTHDQTEAMTLGSRVAVIRLGELQQVAPPQELYQRPVNLFVASFIGSPAMNLVEASVERGDGGPQVCFGPHRLTIGEKAVREHPGLEHYLGRQVVCGIRPEHLEDASLARDTTPGSVIDVSVELREELGSEVDLHCAVGVAPLHLAGLADEDADETAGAAGQADAAAPADAAGEASAAGAGRAPVADPSDPAAPAGSALAATIVARVDPRTALGVGDRARLQVDLAALHFFDPATGTSLRG